MDAIRIDNRIAQEADNMAKELHLPFRDCLDILMNAYLADKDRKASRVVETADGAERSRANYVSV